MRVLSRLRAIVDNPIMRREGFPRFWRRASPAGRTAVVLAYSLVAALPGLAVLVCARAMDSFPSFPAFFPLMMFALSYWPSFLAPVIAPALVAPAIAGERERRTWDMLVVTQLTPAEIIWGKLLSRLMPLLWITIPLVAVTVVLIIVSAVSGPWPVGPGGPAGVGWLTPLFLWPSGLMVTFANAVMALYVSFRCSSTRAALGIAYGAAVAAYVLATMLPSTLLMLMFTPGMGRTDEILWYVASYAPPVLWGVIVPAILLPLMIRRFSRINARVRTG